MTRLMIRYVALAEAAWNGFVASGCAAAGKGERCLVCVLIMFMCLKIGVKDDD